MIFPNIFDYKNSRDYFNDFYELNKQKKKSFSFRFLSNKLKWPSSLMSEIIQGRKNLSLSRALEFSQFAKLNTVETERLIFMSLTNNDNAEVNNFFNNKLELEHNADMSSNVDDHYSGIKNTFKSCIPELKDDLAASALLKLLVSYEGKIKIKDVQNAFINFPELKDIESIEDKLLKLQKNGNIKINNCKRNIDVDILDPIIFFHTTTPEETIKTMSNYLNIKTEMFQNPKNVIGEFNSGFINIDRNDYKATFEKLRMLHNWLLEVDKRAAKNKIGERPNSFLFQYDLSMFALINKLQFKVTSIDEWAKEK